MMSKKSMELTMSRDLKIKIFNYLLEMCFSHRGKKHTIFQKCQECSPLPCNVIVQSNNHVAQSLSGVPHCDSAPPGTHHDLLLVRPHTTSQFHTEDDQ